VALSDEAGDTVEVYEYSIFGQVAASDPNHPNRFLFTGREFDSETGLYYYRARYYNPYIGRFLQTDPAGQGMNSYAYCGNDPICRIDPSGESFSTWHGFDRKDDKLLFWWLDSNDKRYEEKYDSVDDWINWALGAGSDRNRDHFVDDAWLTQAVGWKLAEGQKRLFWEMRAVFLLDLTGYLFNGVDRMEQTKFPAALRVTLVTDEYAEYTRGSKYISWSRRLDHMPGASVEWHWHHFHPLVALGHELAHAIDDMDSGPYLWHGEPWAVNIENVVRRSFHMYDPTRYDTWPRPGWETNLEDLADTLKEAWATWKYQVWGENR
jgi:RHS repeat-associated protein